MKQRINRSINQSIKKKSTDLPLTAINIALLKLVEFGVRPEEFPSLAVEGNGVRCFDVRGDDVAEGWAIGPRRHDARLVEIPISPIQSARLKIFTKVLVMKTEGQY